MKKPQTGLQDQRTIEASIRAVNDESRQVELSFSSEAPYERWFGAEILCHDAGAIVLDRLQEVGSVLFTHGKDPNYGRMPVCKIDKVWLDETDRKGKALVTFDDDEDSERIYQKVKKGLIRGVSAGYVVNSWEEVAAGKTSANGRFTGPAYVALKWEPLEISFEPTPADPSVGVGRSAEEETPPAPGRVDSNHETKEDQRMHNQVTPPVVDEKAVADAAIKAERERTAEITELCRGFEMDPVAFIGSGASVDAVRAQVLETLRERNKPSVGGTLDVRVITEETEKFRSAASDALLMRSGRPVLTPAEGARELRGMKLRDIAIDCLQRSGVSGALRMDDDSLFRAALTPDSQFTAILSDSVNKSMSTAYKAAQPTYQAWTGRGSNPDFKDAKHYQISEAGELMPMTQSGEFKHDEMKDNGVTKAVATFGRKFGFTRQALINDDLSILTKVPEAYVRAAIRGINKLVYKTIGSNPLIYDGKNLFHADHANIGTAGAISTATLGELRKLMRTQKNIRGMETLNISPTFLIVPAALEVDAQKMLFSTGDPAAAHAGVDNVFRNSMKLVVDAELDAYSEKAFYVAAAPADVDTVEVTYLNGDDMPKLESRVGFDFLGIEWRIFIDYGVTVTDFRGLGKNAGQ